MPHAFKNIPAELRALNQWVNWRYDYYDENNKRIDKDTKPKKPPIHVKTGYKIDPTDPTMGVSFNEAVAAYQANKNEIDMNGDHLVSGLGLILTPDDPYCFIDLDQTDDPQTIALQIRIAEVFNSYSEKLPSGSGLHVIVKAGIIRAIKQKEIEIYNRNRYMTMTGDVWNNVPIMDRQQEMNQLCRYLSQNGGNPHGTHSQNQYIEPLIIWPQIEDDALIRTKINYYKHGPTFRALANIDPIKGPNSEEIKWLSGPDKSLSACDFALVNIIVKYTQNFYQIERIWLSTSLAQRWKTQNRSAYRIGTINRVLSTINLHAGLPSSTYTIDI